MTALDDQPPPIIAIGPANQTLPVNTIAVLPCQASGNPKPEISWLKAGRPLLGTADHTSRIMVEPSGTLVIDSKHHSRSAHILLVLRYFKIIQSQ